MVEKIQETLRDSKIARWSALILIAATMFFAYMFVDVLSPLQTALESEKGWSPDNYGTFAGSEYFLNVFAFFLIFAGVILDKMGIRFTSILSGVVMVVGASIKLYAISDLFGAGNALYDFLDSFWKAFPASAKLASVGFMIFGCGVEMAGITVSKAIVKWFSGKELALAMGLEMAIARLGVFAVFRLSPYLADGLRPDIVKPVAVCCALLCIGLLCFIVYSVMDKKLDNQIGEQDVEPEDPFKISDLGKLFTNKTFLIVAFLCVLYYSAIFPFQKFATSMLENRLNIPTTDAAKLFSWFPIGAMVLTPLLGAFLDHKGKGASMLMLGAVLLTVCHLIFALYPLSKEGIIVAYMAIIILGISFSLVPAALWPSVPKLVENRFLGSAYAVIFWIQNIGLLLFPILIGWSLNASNPGISEKIQGLKDDLKAFTTTQDELKTWNQNFLTHIDADYAVDFRTQQFSPEHKNDVFIQKYSTALVVATDTNMTALAANLSKAENRNKLLSLMDNQLNKFNALSRDTTIAVPATVIPIIQKYESDLAKLQQAQGDASYNYTVPMLIFASLGILAFLLGIWLKIEDKRKGYGLEKPNIEN